MTAKDAKKTDAQETDAPKNKKAGLLGKLILLVTLAITSFCTVYFLPREIAPVPTSVATHGADQHSTSQENEDVAPQHIATTFITLEPFTVSIKGRARILRLGITLEVPEVNMDAVDAHNPKLRDAFMGYLSVLDMAQVEDATFLVGLRAQLTRRAKFVLGANNIQNVLITDFMVR